MNIVVLWEPGFPFVDTFPLSRETLEADIPQEMTVVFADLADLKNALSDPSSVLLLPYGSAFPKAVWPVIHEFLKQGGSWLNLGGSPLSRPVRRNKDGTWYVEVSQTAYSKELRINQAFAVDLERQGITLDETRRGPEETTFWHWAHELAGRDGLSEPKIRRVWALQPRFTDTQDFPEESGTGGTRDAVLRALCYIGKDDRRLAAPIVVVDRLRGPFAGGRWVLVNAEFAEAPAPDLLWELLRTAAAGPVELEVRPSFACYYEGEQPTLTVRVRTHRRRDEAVLKIQLCPVGEWEHPFAHWEETVSFGNGPLYRHCHWSPITGLTSGLWNIRATLFVESTGETLAEHESGFWVYDEALLTSGKPLTLNRDYFERDGRPYPVLGTTYMAGDTHRKFLFEPNCAVWNRDFAEMKAAGVNMVRTGLWTGWKRVMLDPGAVDEGVLRAFTAFLLTARKYDIPVIFTFFAFLPDAWGGSNPYLDPRAVESQKELVAAFAYRFAHVNDLLWDFINEPSFSSPARIWSTRPNYDSYERAAWADWLRERAVLFSPEEQEAADPADVWRERWRLTPNAPLELPALDDFQDRHIFRGTHPLRVLDYRLFAQEMFRRWVRTLAEVIRGNGNTHQHITVGQDEGGTGERPNPHFHADVVDFTSNHSWWQNDDLLWDSLMTKTPHKPNLIQETGIMFVENLDGGYRRTPEEAADLLARKLTLAFAGGCAGAIQWLWNTNVYMDDDNEVGIGFFRADGTEKPELEVFRKVARFFEENRDLMVGRKLEEAVLVIPHSHMFSVRNNANIAIRRTVRTLEYSFGVATRTVSEYRIEEIGDPRLIVLPSPRVLTQSCWEALLARVEAGAILVVTGSVEKDEYERFVPRLQPFGLETKLQAIAHNEDFVNEHSPTLVTHFEGDALQKIERAVFLEDRSGSSYRLLPLGQGQIIYCPLPLELTAGGEGAALLYTLEEIMRPLKRMPKSANILQRDVRFANSVLKLIVNESGTEISPVILQSEIPHGIHVPPGGAALAFTDPDGRTLLAKVELNTQASGG